MGTSRLAQLIVHQDGGCLDVTCRDDSRRPRCLQPSRFARGWLAWWGNAPGCRLQSRARSTDAPPFGRRKRSSRDRSPHVQDQPRRVKHPVQRRVEFGAQRRDPDVAHARGELPTDDLVLRHRDQAVPDVAALLDPGGVRRDRGAGQRRAFPFPSVE